jgi:hypothetical protein
MFRRKSSWLPVTALCCLLAAVPAQGANDGEARDVSIPGTGLSFRVAPGVAVSPEKPAHPGDATLFVEVETIQSFLKNGIITKADVLAQRAALAKGQAKVADGWEEVGLAEIVSLPTGGSAVIYPHYSEFEICDLRFTMNAAFFVGNRRVIIRYSLPPAAIIKEDSTFFGHDKANCGTAAVWKHPDPALLKRFHEAAKAGRLGPAANVWYADFKAILASLRQKSQAK